MPTAVLILHALYMHSPRFLLLRPLLRVLSWVGWGLNRVTLRGLRDTKSDMVFLQNLVRPLNKYKKETCRELTKKLSSTARSSCSWSARKVHTVETV